MNINNKIPLSDLFYNEFINYGHIIKINDIPIATTSGFDNSNNIYENDKNNIFINFPHHIKYLNTHREDQDLYLLPVNEVESLTLRIVDNTNGLKVIDSKYLLSCNDNDFYATFEKSKEYNDITELIDVNNTDLTDLVIAFNQLSEFNYVSIDGISNINTVFSYITIDSYDNLIINVDGNLRSDYKFIIPDSIFEIPMQFINTISFKNPKFYDDSLSINGINEYYTFKANSKNDILENDTIMYYTLEDHEDNLNKSKI